jgi:hypothetical protein
VDIIKVVQEEESEILTWGNEVHKKMAERLGPAKKALPSTMAEYETYAAGIERIPGKLLVEQKYGLKADFSGCGYFDSHIWYRGIGDVVVVDKERAFILDWKLGKVLEDSVQLALMAACIFGNYPGVNRVDTVFMWLKHDAKTRDVFRRDDMPGVWAGVLPRVASYKEAVEGQNFPPKPGGLCSRWCPVTTCPHNGGYENA